MEELLRILENERKNLIEFRNEIQKSLSTAPIGKLRVSNSNRCPQYYHKHAGARSRKDGDYIRKSNELLVKQLAQKEYDQELVSVIDDRLKNLDIMITNYKALSLKQVYCNFSPNIKRFIDPRGLSDELFVEQWMSKPYIPKAFREGDPEIYTERQERVRSKTEKIIADRLNHLNIPYRYECPLMLKNGRTIYPDFTILNVRTRKVYYLEHLGMMDNSEYSSKASMKIVMYEKSGIYPGKQLILTFETANQSFDSLLFEQIIQEYFL